MTKFKGLLLSRRLEQDNNLTTLSPPEDDGPDRVNHTESGLEDQSWTQLRSYYHNNHAEHGGREDGTEQSTTGETFNSLNEGLKGEIVPEYRGNPSEEQASSSLSSPIMDLTTSIPVDPSKRISPRYYQLSSMCGTDDLMERGVNETSALPSSNEPPSTQGDILGKGSKSMLNGMTSYRSDGSTRWDSSSQPSSTNITHHQMDHLGNDQGPTASPLLSQQLNPNTNPQQQNHQGHSIQEQHALLKQQHPVSSSTNGGSNNSDLHSLQGGYPSHVASSTLPSPSSSNSSLTLSQDSPSPSTCSGGKKRKRRPQPIPEDCKDDAYWERRKRNNESAKRSREMRRMKEQHTMVRVMHLEQDNLRLKTEVEMLRSELERAREIVYGHRSMNFTH